MRRIRITTILAIFLLLMSALTVFAATAGSTKSIDLTGQWKFTIDPQDIGVKSGWYKAEYDTSTWRQLQVPGGWEDQGITWVNQRWQDNQSDSYNGYAWYRRTVTIPNDWKGKPIYLNLGKIDDTDWTYVNGIKVGNTGSVDQNAWDKYRSYKVPAGIIQYGKPNSIAIRVLDTHGSGGIITGPVSLTQSTPAFAPTATGSYGKVGADRTNTNGSVIIKQNETVGDATAINGQLFVTGHVTGDATAINGNVTITPTGRVDGDVTAIGGRVIRDQGSYVGGSTNSVNVPGIATLVPFFSAYSALSYLWAFLVLLSFVLISIIIAAIFPERVEMIASTILHRPGWSALYGFIAGALILPSLMILIFTLIGIPLIPIWIMILIASWLVASAGVKAAVGHKLGDAVGKPIASVVLAVLIGGVVIALLTLIPIAGALLAFFLNLLGFGAVWMTGFGTHPDWFARRWRKTSPEPNPPSSNAIEPSNEAP